MKKFYMVYLLLFVAVTIGYLLISIGLKIPNTQNVDMIAVNHVVKSVKQNWDSMQRLSAQRFTYDFSVLDKDGACLYQTDASLPTTLYDGTKQGLTVMDVDILGKVMLDTHPQDWIGQLFSQMRQRILASYLILVGMLVIYFLWLYVTILRPFARLSNFAKHISSGQFETPLPMDKQNIFGAFTESFDVMRESLHKARQGEQLANQSKKELIASLSHDIKTPVTSIRLISELLQVQIVNPTHIEKLLMIQTKTEQIDRLVSDLLQSTLDELGQLSVTVTDQSSDVLYPLLSNADAVASIPQCLISLDIRRIEQVIDNILSNAAKYAGTSIDVKLAIVDSFLKIDFNDFGTGVDPSEVDFLCNKFYRGERAIASQKQGEGLGLYIAKLLMTKMGGELECINRDDGFTVSLLLALSR